MKKFILLFAICYSSYTQAQPANDFCTSAIDITCGETLAGTTVSATVDNAIAPNCGSATTTGPGVWYHFVGTGETITLSTCGDANFDTSISVFTGGCISGLTCLAGNDDGDGCASFTSLLNFNSQLAVDYYILLHTFDLASGTFNLTATCAPTAPPPANDDCEDAVTLTVFAE